MLNLKSRSLLSRVFIISIPTLLLLIAIQVYSSRSTLAGVEQMRSTGLEFENRVHRLTTIVNLKSYLYKISICYRNILLSRNAAMREEFVQARSELMAGLTKEKEAFLSNPTSTDVSAFQEIDANLAQFLKISERFDTRWRADGDGVLSEEVRLKGHQMIQEELVPLRDKVSDIVASLVDRDTEDSRAKSDALFASLSREGTVFSILNTGVVIAFGVMIGLGTYRVCNTLNRASLSLGELGSEVRSSSTQVAAASQSLAAGASDAAASIEETAAALNEISGHASASATAAAESASVAKVSLESALQGRQRVNDLVAAVQRVSDCSTRIGDISRIIDDVAFQTNLLALNAAVEAARAGDAGKGFAVVAEEVRGLAHRCSKSAKGITEVVQETVTRVTEGLTCASAAGESLQEIIKGAERVAAINGQVSQTILHQQAQIKEVTEAITRLDGTTQANAAASEETSASAFEMTRQAETLHELSQSLVATVQGTDALGPEQEQPDWYPEEEPSSAKKVRGYSGASNQRSLHN